MFNAFKGIKLFGVRRCRHRVRSAGGQLDPHGDWYAAEVAWLVEHQTSLDGRGRWWLLANLFFSAPGAGSVLLPPRWPS